MKTLTISLDDTIYDRLVIAGTKTYSETMANPDYDPKYQYDPEGEEEEKANPVTVPNTKQTRDQHLAAVVDTAIKNILKTHEVQDVSNKAVIKKQKEIESLAINTTIS